MRACSTQIQSRNLRQINNEILSQAHVVSLERLEHVAPSMGGEVEGDEGGREEDDQQDQGLQETEGGPVMCDRAADHLDISEHVRHVSATPEPSRHVTALEDHDYVLPEVGMAGKLTGHPPNHDYCLEYTGISF